MIRWTVKLPVPPSTNALFVSFIDRSGTKARAKTKEYKAWITAAGFMLNTQRPAPIKGPVAVAISVPRNRRRDLDNHLKASLDLLVGHSLIEDDRIIETLTIGWHDLGHKDMLVNCLQLDYPSDPLAVRKAREVS